MKEELEKSGNFEEKQLVLKAKQGDREAFGSLYDLYAPRIYRFIFLKTDRNDAEDLLHEVFLSAWKGMNRYEPTAFPFTSWLYQIARNRVIDHYRAARPNVSLDELMANNALPVALASTANNAMMNALHQKFELHQIMEAVRELGEEQQTVIIMRFVEDMPPEEIALAMGKTASGVRLIQHRALKKLKAFIQTKNHGTRLSHNRTA